MRCTPQAGTGTGVDVGCGCVGTELHLGRYLVVEICMRGGAGGRGGGGGGQGDSRDTSRDCWGGVGAAAAAVAVLELLRLCLRHAGPGMCPGLTETAQWPLLGLQLQCAPNRPPKCNDEHP